MIQWLRDITHQKLNDHITCYSSETNTYLKLSVINVWWVFHAQSMSNCRLPHPSTTSLLHYSITQTHLPVRWSQCWCAYVQPVVGINILISLGYWVISVSETQHGCLRAAGLWERTRQTQQTNAMLTDLDRT